MFFLEDDEYWAIERVRAWKYLKKYHPTLLLWDRSIHDTNDLTGSPFLRCISCNLTGTKKVIQTNMSAAWSASRNGWAPFRIQKVHWLYITTGLVDKETAARHICGELHAWHLCSSSNCVGLACLVFENPHKN